MRSVTIEDLGICAAIKKYAVHFGQRHKLEMVLELPRNIKMSYDISLMIFHVMQLALQNVAEHANASRVDIKLRTTKASLYFILADNGIGITAQQLASNKSFGIIGMREDATTAGGRLSIENGTSGGTIIQIIIHINKL
jgi:signal transduction histidine kinase